MGKLNLIEDRGVVEFGDVSITAVGFQGENSNNYAYLIK